MIKPYIYGGIALFIVGLISYVSFISAKLETANILVEQSKEVIVNLEKANKDLLAASNRKAGAANAYMSMIDMVARLTKDAGNIIRGYKPRETENEKCLDFTPPQPLIDRLRAKDNIQGQNYSGRPFFIFDRPLHYDSRTYYV